MTNATDYGGAVYVEGDFVNITGSNFSRCIAYDYDGGAICINGINTTISGSHFVQNRVTGVIAHGGSIDIKGDGARILSSTFMMCTAADGGVAYIEGANVTWWRFLYCR